MVVIGLEGIQFDVIQRWPMGMHTYVGCKLVNLYESMNLINKRVSLLIKSENFTLD